MRLTRRQAFAIAAVIGLIVAALVYFVLTKQTGPTEPTEPEELTVVVTTQEIPAYTTVTGEMLTTKKMASKAAPDNAISSPEQVIGLITQTAMGSGQTLTEGSVGPRSATQGLTFVIPKNLRAVTVALDPISGVGGFVYPGDHVDVLATFERAETAVTKTILQNVEVLAMNEQTTRPGSQRPQQPSDEEANGGDGSEAPATEQVKSATLAVAPDEAQSLILSAYKGAVHLVLRAREDESVVSLSGQTDWALMGLEPPEEPEEEAPPQQPDQPPMAGWPQGWGAPMQQPQQPAAEPEPQEPEEAVEIIRGGEREVVTPP